MPRPASLATALVALFAASAALAAGVRPGVRPPVDGRLVKKTTPAASAPPTALSPADREAVLAAHNALRAAVGSPPLAWSAEVAAFAERRAVTLAQTCTLAHAPGPYGENLAGQTGVHPAADGVALWAAEKDKFAGGTFDPAAGAGHYTQVVWRATTQVGCAAVQCQKDAMTWTLQVCNYAPPGNILGQPVF